MDQEELKKILHLLQAQGFDPQVCNKEIPVMTAGAVCGSPVPIGDEGVERIMKMPMREDIQAIVVKVHGDSMIDVGYTDGDEVVVELKNSAEDGDIVLAVLDGESTIKAILRDGQKSLWLIPQNKNYQAIPVTEKNDFFIVGVVMGLYRRSPRLQLNAMVDYLTSASRSGRPQRKAFSDILVQNFRKERLDHLHVIMEGKRGKEAAFIMQTALKIYWILENPTFESVEEEFGKIGGKSNFYKYLRLKMTQEEKSSYYELFREVDRKLRAATLAAIEAEEGDEMP
ncbi:MAG: hypothetical protein IKR91_02175 [Alloprevotella sp.]|nr:hypothetical protein [Alloprevotella sp.]